MTEKIEQPGNVNWTREKLKHLARRWQSICRARELGHLDCVFKLVLIYAQELKEVLNDDGVYEGEKKTINCPGCSPVYKPGLWK